MSYQYRIVERKNIFNENLRFFPQVKLPKLFGIYGTWRKIAKHSGGFSLYSSNDYKYPKTKKAAQDICAAFDEWIKVENNTVNIIHTLKL